MAYGTRLIFDAVREKAAGDITGSYTSLGTPTSEFTRIIAISNSTDLDVYISFDGTTNNLRLAANSFKLFDISSNKIRDDGLFISSGTQVYVKYVTSTTSTGSVWVESAYAEGGV